ncbi:MAG: hypothetical protein ACRD2I_27760 [Vicinamibacterales bacterium]
MRLLAVLFTAALFAAPAWAQPAAVSPSPDAAQDGPAGDRGSGLPVSLSKIREGLEKTPTLSLRTIDERPLFRLQIQERQKIEQLLATLNFKAGPVPAGGVYMAEQNRIMFPSVDNPLRQPLAAFNQPELLTILIENLAGRYLAAKAGGVISKAERANAEAAAKEEVRAAVAQYCGSQPNAGGGLQICDGPIR